MSDLIDRYAAIDAVSEVCGEWRGIFVRCEEKLLALPSTQPDVPDTNVGDMISRQAAIDIERRATVDTNPEHFESHQKFVQFMDNAEISSFGRWQWSNGFNTALTAVGIDLKRLPSAQPKHLRESTKMMERKTGRWERHYSRPGVYADLAWHCSECGAAFDDSWAHKWHYCPDCGAEMEELNDI